MEEKINNPIPDDVYAQAMEKIKSAATDLKPYLLALTADERKKLPKMSDGTEPFVDKSMDYTTTNPEFKPAYVSAEKFSVDMDTREKTRKLMNPLDQLLSDLNDTCTQSGSEAYSAALGYYNSVKQAAKMSVPGSKPIYDDLKKRFEKGSNGNNKDDNSNSPEV